jgi:iron complex outermembrane receptor protein
MQTPWQVSRLDSARAATQAAQEAKQAANLDLDQLASMDVKVTSASKKSENLFSAPAAIYVLSGEQILRGGFSSVPDALRSVPGLYVAQEDSHSWIVAARGFSYAFNNKMLVLLDGRLLYDPLFGGVYWDTFDPPLGDIDRIEIILGPGGTLWGANAVNGVINIITKNSQKTQGLAVAASAGIDERDKASLRYGGGIGQNLSYRIFAQGMYGDPTVDASGTPQPDQWNLQQGGLRLDWSLSPRDNFSSKIQRPKRGKKPGRPPTSTWTNWPAWT